MSPNDQITSLKYLQSLADSAMILSVYQLAILKYHHTYEEGLLLQRTFRGEKQ